MCSISYAISVCTEHLELQRLFEKLLPHLQETDEIVVQIDKDNTTSAVRTVLDKVIKQKGEQIKVVYFSLENNFARFKNHLKDTCKKDYIFFIDADEYPSAELLENLSSLLELNPAIDLYLIPRINTVEGITAEHIQKWRWRVDTLNRINYPDYQTRIIANKSGMQWEGKVHERIIGHSTMSIVPEDLGLVLYHPKTIDRQEKQNRYYNTL